ncbi:MAG TPA: glycosyltransferase family 4 protein [Bryobacteraceae bacterium]|nr:glycosyltransferase family 4 protein [Bryobacteraceae bacterium]
MAPKKLLCVFTTLLGHATVTQRFMRALNRMPGIEPTYVLVGAEDFERYRAPWWMRATEPWRGQFIARRKAEPLFRQKFDMLLVNAWEFAVAFRDLAHGMPAIAAMDAIPATFYNQRRQNVRFGIARWISHQLYHRSFGRAAREFDLFLPKSSTCARALREQHEIPAGRCFVTLAPQFLETWKPVSKPPSSRLQLLFAGNDFRRKGGEFLLRLFSERLAGHCTLTIASNDRSLTGRQFPDGVRLLQGQGRDALIPLYGQHDLFVFPTQQDFTPEVVAEALATGMPCLATEVDGIRDLILDSVNGYVMPPHAPIDSWAEPILSLAANPGELRRMSVNARKFAEAELDFERFEELLAGVIHRLAVPDPAAETPEWALSAGVA